MGEIRNAHTLFVGIPERRIVHRYDADIEMDFNKRRHECMDWAVVCMVMNLQVLSIPVNILTSYRFYFLKNFPSCSWLYLFVNEYRAGLKVYQAAAYAYMTRIFYLHFLCVTYYFI
jgi:hypothetical protein